MASLTSLRRSVRLLNVPSRASTFADNSRNLLRSRFAFAINCCARKSIYAGIQRRSRSNKEIRARNESALSSSQGRCPEKAKEAGQEACYLPQNQTLRQGLERSFRFPRPCLRVVWRITLAREFAVGETLAEHLTHAKLKTLAIVHVLAVVETEHLLVKVAVEMIRFHTHIRAMQPALYETPLGIRFHYCHFIWDWFRHIGQLTNVGSPGFFSKTTFLSFVSMVSLSARTR